MQSATFFWTTLRRLFPSEDVWTGCGPNTEEWALQSKRWKGWHCPHLLSLLLSCSMRSWWEWSKGLVFFWPRLRLSIDWRSGLQKVSVDWQLRKTPALFVERKKWSSAKERERQRERSWGWGSKKEIEEILFSVFLSHQSCKCRLVGHTARLSRLRELPWECVSKVRKMKRGKERKREEKRGKERKKEICSQELCILRFQHFVCCPKRRVCTTRNQSVFLVSLWWSVPGKREREGERRREKEREGEKGRGKGRDAERQKGKSVV